MEYTVIGREADGMFVLFGLGDGVYATVTEDGDVKYSLGWLTMTKFVTIDTRGSEAVPANELRDAIFALKTKYDKSKVEELRNEAIKRADEVQFNEEGQKRYCEMVDRMPKNPDGSIRWNRGD